VVDTMEGEAVGSVLGESVGDPLGISVGSSMGRFVGSGVGVDEFDVGYREGTVNREGSAVGSVVGSSVGSDSMLGTNSITLGTYVVDKLYCRVG